MVLELLSAVLSWPVQQYIIFIIYELKHLQRLNGSQGIIQASHLYRRLELPNPSCSSFWCVCQPALQLCQDTLTLLNIWQFTAKAGKSSKDFRTLEHPCRILEEQGYLLYDLTCLKNNWQSRKLSCLSISWFIIHPTSFGTVI